MPYHSPGSFTGFDKNFTQISFYCCSHKRPPAHQTSPQTSFSLLLLTLSIYGQLLSSEKIMRARVRRRFRKAFFFVLSSLLLFVAFPILSQRLRGFTDAPRPPLARSELETDWILEPSGKLVIPLDDDGNAIPRSGKAPGHPISQLVKEAAEGWELMVSR